MTGNGWYYASKCCLHCHSFLGKWSINGFFCDGQCAVAYNHRIYDAWLATETFLKSLWPGASRERKINR